MANFNATIGKAKWYDRLSATTKIRSTTYAWLKFAHLVEFVEGNTVTWLHFMRLRRPTQGALQTGKFTPELVQTRAESVPTFTHFLDLATLFVIVALGAINVDKVANAMLAYGVM